MGRGETYNGRDFITPHDIQLISGYDLEGAQREHQNIRKALGFNSKDLMISQYCKYYDLEVEEVIDFLYPSHPEEKWTLEDEEESERDNDGRYRAENGFDMRDHYTEM